MSFLTDERGNRSTARLLCALELVYVWVLGWRDSLAGGIDVPGPVWALHGSLVVALITWAAGPRIAQHLGGQVAGVAQGVAQAAKRLMGTDDRYKDSERDP